MALPNPQILIVGTEAARRRIAYLHRPAGMDAGGGLFWLSGFKSEMTGSKATHLAEFAAARGLAMTRFDYSGHGQSQGRFEEGTIGAWLDESEAVFLATAHGPRVVIGSSMGGYLALLLLRRLMSTHADAAALIRALVLIAPAWDMTEKLMWSRFSQAARDEIMTSGAYCRPSRYGDGPYTITRTLIEEGRNHLISDSRFNPGRPVHILHGLLDPDVPWEHSLELESLMTGGWVRVIAVPDGEHRLSRPEDLDRLTGIIDSLLPAPA